MGRRQPSISRRIKTDELWYKKAIIYQIHVRSFFDSNGDGIGDFRGLIEKLDYFLDLGVTAIWLLPFYPSPLKDDGYDIADYEQINPSYGTMRDFRDFLREAHARDLKVITELVLNHTSDQHAWFQRSRHAAKGSKWRDFYVWTDDPKKYSEARIIFRDFETSNWTWDPAAQQYYWHRFYSHQPDLNFDNPMVKKKMFEVMDYWLEMGVDGVRLDAVPYLFEREGTSCENLKETHDFLKDLRTHVDNKFENKMLLAEANQWPEDAVTYFGEGDECHMNFHFPLMPRLFMALKLEDRFSILDILRQTPAIPDSCQWAIFLRNHDELTLEMVTDEERDYMYNVYATEPQARINLGIRRRLAPLLGNDRRQIKLLNGLLFSLPGAPIVYYGDEIGMGDNIYLGDRDGVRTPFQWSPDRNAGFSRADAQQLFLPMITTPEYRYEAINVESQLANTTSLLWWMKGVIALRKKYPALEIGSLEFLEPDSRKVLSFIRKADDNTVLVVANLSRKAQYVELDLKEFKGLHPVEIFGQVPFPEIGDLPYFITLGPYAFYWFVISEEPTYSMARPLLRTVRSQGAQTAQPAEPIHALSSPGVHEKITHDLPEYLAKMRWFAGKSRQISECTVEASIPLESGGGRTPSYALLFVEVAFSEGKNENYLLTLAYADQQDALNIVRDNPNSVISMVQADTPEYGLYYDATVEAEFFQQMIQLLLRRREISVRNAKVSFDFHRPVKKEWLKSPPNPSLRGFEQSNTAVLFGTDFFFKLFRKIDPGISPEIEIGKYLTYEKKFSQVPALLGSISMTLKKRQFSLAVLQQNAANEGDAWSYTIDALLHSAENMMAVTGEEHEIDISLLNALKAFDEQPEELDDVTASYRQMVGLLGQRVGEMHLAMSTPRTNDAFTPEDSTPFYQRSFYQSLRNLTEGTMSTLRQKINILSPEDRKIARSVLELEEKVLAKFGQIKRGAMKSKRIRVHGDLHLGQVLFTGNDFLILDFEGEPARSIGERRVKKSPLKDVAGMLRSFDYAVHYVARHDAMMTADPKMLWPRLKRWNTAVKTSFLRRYLDVTSSAEFFPVDDGDFQKMLEVYLLEKALYEVAYELNTRPDWAHIPLADVSRIVQKGV